MLQTEKQQLRRYYRETRRTLSSDEKRFIDCKISDNLLNSDLYRDAACIFCYVSTSDEIGTAAILEQALTDGKTLCVPLCGKGGSVLRRTVSEYLLAFYARKENRGLDIFADCNALQ